MNLYALTVSGAQPRTVCDCLGLFFEIVDVERRECGVYPYQLIARDEDGRTRLRIPYFWSERNERWIYSIQKGDRP